jgi:hypothetical protein
MCQLLRTQTEPQSALNNEQELSNKLHHRGVGVRVEVATKDFSLLHEVQSDSEVHPSSNQGGTMGSFPEVKEARA